MAKGNPQITVRLPQEDIDALDELIAAMNVVVKGEPYTRAEWVRKAIRDAQAKRERSRGRKSNGAKKGGRIMNRVFHTTGNAYLLSLLDVGRPDLFEVEHSGVGVRLVMRNYFLSAPWVPQHWHVINGDVLEVERIGRTGIRVTVLEGKERADARQWLHDFWDTPYTSTIGGAPDEALRTQPLRS